MTECKIDHDSYDSTSIDKFYNEHYAQYLMNKEELLDARLRLVLNIFRDKKPANILDIGCGNGNFATLLNKITEAKVIGIDVSENAVGLACKSIESYKVDVGQDKYPFEDGYFEGIFCGEIIEHLFDTDHLLNEINRIMSNNGFCVLTTPNLAAWYNRISLALGYQPFYTEVSIYHNVGKLSSAGGTTSTGHIRGFTYRSLMELLKEHQFNVIKVFGIHDYHIPAPISLIEKSIARFPSLASFMVVVFKKF